MKTVAQIIFMILLSSLVMAAEVKGPSLDKEDQSKAEAIKREAEEKKAKAKIKPATEPIEKTVRKKTETK